MVADVGLRLLSRVLVLPTEFSSVVTLNAGQMVDGTTYLLERLLELAVLGVGRLLLHVELHLGLLERRELLCKPISGVLDFLRCTESRQSSR